MTTNLNLSESRELDHEIGHEIGHEVDEPEATDVELDGVSRRTFLNIMGASAALAGVGMSGCIRKPVTKIVPYATRPEDVVEGVPLFFASAYHEGATVTGIIVESHEGRPTKIAGNKAHRDSLGATNATTQASVLGLYDLDRSTMPHGKLPREQASEEQATEAPHGAAHGGAAGALSWDAAWAEFDKLAAAAKGQQIAIVLPSVMSPTTRRLLTEAKTSFPQARFFRSDLLWPAAAMGAAQTIAGNGSYALTHLDKADVVAAFDADILGGEPGSVRMTKGFSKKRKVSGPGQPMNRLYVVEPTFSSTGAVADHRARVKAADVGKALGLLASELGKNGVTVDAALAGALPQANLDARSTRLIASLSKDLAGHRGAAVVTVGVRQPAWVHALGYAINVALGAGDGPQTWHNDPTMPVFEDLAAFAQGLTGKAFQTIFVIDANPAFTSPGGLGIAAALADANLVHAGIHSDETGRRATLHIPLSHYLEAWGDLQSLSGVTSVQQPLIDPLHYTPSALEVLGRLVRGRSIGGYDLVRETWKLDEATWEAWLHDGVRAGELEAPGAPGTIDFGKAADLVRVGAQTMAGGVSPSAAVAASEIIFDLDPNLLDGRFANNGWMRELPHPMSKITWDNVALMNKATANGLSDGELVKVTVDGKSVELPAHVLPGVADGVVVLSLGNGRRGLGRVANQFGYDTYPALPANFESAGWFASGTFTSTGESVKLANAQPKGNSLTPRPVVGFGPKASPDTYANGKGVESYEPRIIALQATLDQYAKQPDFPDKINDRIMPDEKVKSWMYPERPNQKDLAGGATTDDVYLNGVHQWGMSIDLNVCTGCNACTTACQAENNIAVVGKKQVLNGREMHWIRLDRYFSGTDDEVEAVLQPLPCQQCETAPCEAVCPVKATAHSNEGLNDMIYNRCIGTRYCSNNCPFKVRRYNWFNFNLDLHPLEQMQKNPDVTVRFRGVMEKCTYCVQRINRAKIQAKIHGNGQVQDGAIETACQEVCPADAIVFGDLRDTNSAVVKAKTEPRTYQLLRELNLRARTTYQAKLKNPNPDLV